MLSRLFLTQLNQQLGYQFGPPHGPATREQGSRIQATLVLFGSEEVANHQATITIDLVPTQPRQRTPAETRTWLLGLLREALRAEEAPPPAES
jgi:hypothetical protein